MKKAMILGFALIASASVLSGCNNDKSLDAKADSQAMAAVNTKCPYSGQPANADIASDYKGKKVAFCCNGCKGKFDKGTDADKAAKFATAMAK